MKTLLYKKTGRYSQWNDGAIYHGELPCILADTATIELLKSYDIKFRERNDFMSKFQEINWDEYEIIDVVVTKCNDINEPSKDEIENFLNEKFKNQIGENYVYVTDKKLLIKSLIEFKNTFYEKIKNNSEDIKLLQHFKDTCTIADAKIVTDVEEWLLDTEITGDNEGISEVVNEGIKKERIHCHHCNGGGCYMCDGLGALKK